MPRCEPHSARCLFRPTHYHEMTALSDRLAGSQSGEKRDPWPSRNGRGMSSFCTRLRRGAADRSLWCAGGQAGGPCPRRSSRGRAKVLGGVGGRRRVAPRPRLDRRSAAVFCCGRPLHAAPAKPRPSWMAPDRRVNPDMLSPARGTFWGKNVLYRLKGLDSAEHERAGQGAARRAISGQSAACRFGQMTAQRSAVIRTGPR